MVVEKGSEARLCAPSLIKRPLNPGGQTARLRLLLKHQGIDNVKKTTAITNSIDLNKDNNVEVLNKCGLYRLRKSLQIVSYKLQMLYAHFTIST
jgi:hypothetical protein